MGHLVLAGDMLKQTFVTVFCGCLCVCLNELFGQGKAALSCLGICDFPDPCLGSSCAAFCARWLYMWCSCMQVMVAMPSNKLKKGLKKKKVFWQRQAGYTVSLFMGHRSNFLVPMLTTAQKTLTYVHTEEGNWVLQIWFPWNKACRNSVHCQVMDAVHLIRPLCVIDGCRWLVRRLCGLITKCQECLDSSLLWSMHAHTCMHGIAFVCSHSGLSCAKCMTRRC